VDVLFNLNKGGNAKNQAGLYNAYLQKIKLVFNCVAVMTVTASRHKDFQANLGEFKNEIQ